MTINFAFISSHDNRIQCLLNNIYNNNIKNNVKNKRIKNCAIMKVYLTKQNNNLYYKIKMIYEGEIDTKLEDAQTFWTLNDFNANYKQYLYNQEIIDVLYKNKLTIFIIRHGKGIHNINMKERKILGIKDLFASFFTLNNNYSLSHPFFDANLTSIGIQQAINAGNALKIYLLKKYNKNNISDILNNNYIICASKLYRTRQTIAYVMSQLINNMNIIILPCINEVSVIEKNGVCNNNNFKDRLAYENQTNCNIKEKRADNKKCLDIIIKKNINNNINIDWSYYDKINNNDSCINQNIIETVINFIKN